MGRSSRWSTLVATTYVVATVMFPRARSISDECLDEISSPCANELLETKDGEELLKSLLSECGLLFHDDVSLRRSWIFRLLGVDALLVSSLYERTRVCFDVNDDDKNSSVEIGGTHAGWIANENLGGYRYDDGDGDGGNGTIITSQLGDENRSRNVYAHLRNGVFLVRRWRFGSTLWSLGVPGDVNATPACLDDRGEWEQITGRPVVCAYVPWNVLRWYYSVELSAIDLLTFDLLYVDEEPTCASLRRSEEEENG